MDRRCFLGGILAASGLAVTSGESLFVLRNQARAGEHPKGNRLARPVPVEVDGKPLVRASSYVSPFLFPFVGDLDGDGRQALLLGTQEDGRLLVYRNVGSKTSPRLSAPQWFDDTVPSGRIPKG
jgi:glucose/arabinose dehydrogenase